MKARLKLLTSRNKGWGYAKRKQKLKEYIRGWMGYYHLAEMHFYYTCRLRHSIPNALSQLFLLRYFHKVSEAFG